VKKNLTGHTWDKEGFINFLIKKKGHSKKVASNHASRCVRIEKLLEINLQKSVKDKASYTKLMLMILDHSRKQSDTPTSQYSFAGTHRSAVRYFAEYLFGHQLIQTYPRNHNLGR
jgi:hypothetical protein